MPPPGRTCLIHVFALLFLVATATAQILTSRPPPLSAWDYASVRPIAAEIQAAAERARLAASQQTRPTRREQATALTELTALAGAAQHFSAQLDRYRQDPEPTRPDYLHLVTLYHQTRQNVVNAGYDAGVVGDFGRIEDLLDRLSLVYTQRWDHARAMAAAEALDAALANAVTIARQHARDQSADQRCLFLLERLAQGARFFRHQLDREPDPLMTGESFRDLESDYVLAVRGLQPASFEHFVEGDLARAGQALAQLRQAYQVQWNGPNARIIADQIRVCARLALNRALEHAARDGGTEPRLLDHLRLLAEMSDRLARYLELSSEMPLRTYPDFLLLAAAYNEAGLDLARAWFGSQMMPEFNGVGQQIMQLHRMYSWAIDHGSQQLTGTVIGR